MSRFTTKEFGPNKTFSSLKEYLDELQKLAVEKKTVLEREPGILHVTEEDIDIDSGLNSVKILAELKPVTDKVEGVEQRIENIEGQMSEVLEIMKSMIEYTKKIGENRGDLNKDGVPIGLILHGTTGGKSYRLKVEKEHYIVGENNFKTLSAAALAVSGNRRSGFVFWKLPDGRSVGELRCKTEGKE
jgi:hypothetical protein